MDHRGWMIYGSLILKANDGPVFKNPRMQINPTIWIYCKVITMRKWKCYREVALVSVEKFHLGDLVMLALFTITNLFCSEALTDRDGWTICSSLISIRKHGLKYMPKGCCPLFDLVRLGPRMIPTFTSKVVMMVWKEKMISLPVTWRPILGRTCQVWATRLVHAIFTPVVCVSRGILCRFVEDNLSTSAHNVLSV